MNRVLLGSYDWNHPAWAQTYYPHDMPGDWRLPYYASRFYTVALDIAALAIKPGLKPIMQQLQDCHESFSPVIRVQPAVTEPVQLDEWITALHDTEVVPAGIWFDGDMDNIQVAVWRDRLVGQRIVCSGNRRSLDLAHTQRHGIEMTLACCSWQVQHRQPCWLILLDYQQPHRQQAQFLASVTAKATDMHNHQCCIVYRGYEDIESLYKVETMLDLLGC